MASRGGNPPVIFAGPTLPAAEIGGRIEATCLPPAAQGAIVSAVRRFRPRAILLIDGAFQGEPAVRHKEILWAMAEGVTVLGAASMGALRAAELWRHGMIGVGLAYRWYRRYPLLRDDAVAVTHAPAELGYRALTHSLIDLRMTMRAAHRRGLLGQAMRASLDRAAATIGFRERTLATVVALAMRTSKMALDEEAMTDMLVRCFVDQKRADALAALTILGRLMSKPGRTPRRAAPFTMTTAFLRDLRHAGIDPP